jgi:coenzyme F420-reducing hydrogenase gamma subunit
MLDFHRKAMFLLMLSISAATTMTLANAQEPAISEGERRGLGACLAKCPDGDMKCDNRCISQFQTRGAWSDHARACIRACRNEYRGGTQQAADGIFGCSVSCVP